MNVNPDEIPVITEIDPEDGLKYTAMHSPDGFVTSMDIDMARIHNRDAGLFDDFETVKPTDCCFRSGHHSKPEVATVFAGDFLCDVHWLRCDKCGTGMFYGIEWVGCPRCDAADMKEHA